MMTQLKWRSFRFRIALLTVALSGIVLLGFGAWAWTVAQRLSIERVDKDIRDIALRQLSFTPGLRRWGGINESLRFVYGDEKSDPLILLVKGRDGNVVYRSDNWPPEISVDSFPSPEQAGDWPMEGPPDFGPPHGPDGEFLEGPDSPRPFGPHEGPPGHPRRMGGPPRIPIHTYGFQTQGGGGRDWRLGVFGNPDVTLVLGLNLERSIADMRALRKAFLVALPLALLVIAMAGWWISERALKPVRDLTRAAEGITAKGLDRRIPVKDEDEEFKRLISVFNGMMNRLEKSFQQAVRFSADAAHELKTPLTILQGELEQALQTAPPASNEQQVYSTLLEEVQRLKSIMRKLLLLSLADSGQLKPHLEPLNFTELLESVCEDTEILAPHLKVEKDLEPDKWIMADPDLIRQVVQNLSSNAIKYNRKEGFVRLRLRGDRGAVRFTIANAGNGIPAADWGKVFDRFYRADKARNRSVDGVGLGLSLSREIARAHHGDLTLDESRDGLTSFTLTLPPTELRPERIDKPEGEIAQRPSPVK